MTMMVARLANALPSRIARTRAQIPRRHLILIALAAVYLIWGSTYLAIRIGLESFPPFLFAAMRFLIAGSVLYAFCRARGQPAPAPRTWGLGAAAGLMFFTFSNGAITYAQLTVSSGLAALIVASMPLWAAIFSAIAGRRPAPAEIAGLAIGFAGVVLLKSGGGIGTLDPHGIAVLLAPISFALGSVFVPRFGLPRGAIVVAVELIGGGAALLAISLAAGETWPAEVSTRSILALAYLIVCGSWVAFTAYDWLIRNVRPAVATSYAYVNPLVAVALGVGLAGETMEPAALTAGVLIVASVAVINLSALLRRRR